MKIVVIGGGIAGLSFGIFLKGNENIEVVVCERTSGMPVGGHAFLMHEDGYQALKKLSNDYAVTLPARKIKEFNFKRPDDHEIKHLKLASWYCIRRSDLISFLYAVFPAEQIRLNRQFSHFLYEGDRATAAVFLDGSVEYGDIFIGADGGNSRVRDTIFPGVTFTPVQVKEIVGISYCDDTLSAYNSAFTKYQDDKESLAFGFIPTAGGAFVWFMQYDPQAGDISDTSPEALKSFCLYRLQRFPDVVRSILATNDFSISYLWETRDFDLLPSFHKSNIALIGDAAHLSLPFTSAGTTNAILDARTLADYLAYEPGYSVAFEKYYKEREYEIAEHIRKGRELKAVFLDPGSQREDDIPVPLALDDKDQHPAIHQEKKIIVRYFTDPVCSTCWIIQPLLRKLKLEYDDHLEVEYCMGGLLPSWEEYNQGKISKPEDAARHWEEMCLEHGMPLDGDIWIEDPLASSYPPSVAFKAAQMQDTDKAILFLRRIKEMLFLEKKNIIKWEHLRSAAFEAGLDSARLLRDYEGPAQELFRKDLLLAQELGVSGFPTLFFTDRSGRTITLRGLHAYERFEQVIGRLAPNISKKRFDGNAEELFNFFPSMTDKEFIFLANISKIEANNILYSLQKNGKVEKYESKNGVIWRRVDRSAE